MEGYFKADNNNVNKTVRLKREINSVTSQVKAELLKEIQTLIQTKQDQVSKLDFNYLITILTCQQLAPTTRRQARHGNNHSKTKARALERA